MTFLIALRSPMYASAANGDDTRLRTCAYETAVSRIHEVQKASGTQTRAAFKNGAAQLSIAAHIMLTCVTESGLASGLRPQAVHEAISDGMEKAASDSFVD